MKILRDYSVISDDGIYLGKTTFKDLDEYVAKGIFKNNGDGTYSGTYDGTTTASLSEAKKYLREHNLTVPSPCGGWMTPEDSKRRK